MKKIMFLSLMLAVMPKLAMAQTNTFTSYSTATWCNISVSTSAAIRADNFNGLCDGLLLGRAELHVTVPSGTVHYGFDANLSTRSVSAKYGNIISNTTPLVLRISSSMKLYLFSEDATEPKAIIEQFRPNAKTTYVP